jgi:hypothetical protein
MSILQPSLGNISTHQKAALCPTKSLSLETIVEKLADSLANVRVDLDPHQVEAALFAFRSPV